MIRKLMLENRQIVYMTDNESEADSLPEQFNIGQAVKLHSGESGVIEDTNTQYYSHDLIERVYMVALTPDDTSLEMAQEIKGLVESYADEEVAVDVYSYYIVPERALLEINKPALGDSWQSAMREALDND